MRIRFLKMTGIWNGKYQQLSQTNVGIKGNIILCLILFYRFRQDYSCCILKFSLKIPFVYIYFKIYINLVLEKVEIIEVSQKIYGEN